MILILRGHIRVAFNNTRLYKLVETICTIYPDIKIYIHSWNERANNLSWRQIDTRDNFVVNEQVITEYFKDLSKHIKAIIIDNDKTIVLNGSLEGKVGISMIPMIGWKNYWYGQHKIIDYIYNNTVDHNEVVINTRFDILENSVSFNESNILTFINSCKDRHFDKNTFIYNEERNGIDNIYIGSIKTMHKLVSYFHNNLDYILATDADSCFPERLVPRINNKIF